MIKAGIDIFTLRKLLNNDGEEWETDSHSITQSGNYCHEYTMSIELCVRGNPPEEIQKAYDQMQEIILEDARDLAKELYKSLEEEYENQTSDEAIIEGLNANDKKFRKDGEEI